MVYDDEKINDVNEVHKLMKECASFVSKKEARNYSPFYVLAFNALKGTVACFKSVVKCEQIVKLWNDAITNFHVIEDYKEHMLSHFLTGRLPPALFLDYVETMRSIKPSNPVRTLDEWILSNH